MATKGQTLKEFAKNNIIFLEACHKAGIQATRRQAAKWHQGRGAAFNHRNETTKEQPK